MTQKWGLESISGHFGVGLPESLWDHFNWETDFYTPPVLGGAALLPFSVPAVYKKKQGP